MRVKISMRAAASVWLVFCCCCCTCRSWDWLITELLSLSSTLGCIVERQPEANRSSQAQNRPDSPWEYPEEWKQDIHGQIGKNIIHYIVCVDSKDYFIIFWIHEILWKKRGKEGKRSISSCVRVIWVVLIYCWCNMNISCSTAWMVAIKISPLIN